MNRKLERVLKFLERVLKFLERVLKTRKFKKVQVLFNEKKRKKKNDNINIYTD
jgi:hypothetical protein